MLVINVSGKSQNIDTERISEMFIDDVLYLFSTNPAVQFLLVATMALLNLFVVMYRHWQHLIKMSDLFLCTDVSV